MRVTRQALRAIMNEEMRKISPKKPTRGSRSGAKSLGRESLRKLINEEARSILLEQEVEEEEVVTGTVTSPATPIKIGQNLGNLPNGLPLALTQSLMTSDPGPYTGSALEVLVGHQNDGTWGRHGPTVTFEVTESGGKLVLDKETIQVEGVDSSTLSDSVMRVITKAINKDLANDARRQANNKDFDVAGPGYYTIDYPLVNTALDAVIEHWNTSTGVRPEGLPR